MANRREGDVEWRKRRRTMPAELWAETNLDLSGRQGTSVMVFGGGHF